MPFQKLKIRSFDLDRFGSARRPLSLRQRRRFAFTLIELLVVIAIISLLVSILLPSLTQAKEMAKAVLCLSHLRGTGTALYLYGHDHDYVVLPSYWDRGQVIVAEEWGPYAGSFNGTWAMAVYPNYAGTPWMWTCPVMKDYDQQYFSNEDRPDNPRYPYHWWYANIYGIDGESGWNNFRRLEEIDQPAEKLYLCDSVYCPPGEPYESYVVFKGARTFGNPRHTPHIRHLERCGVIFFDGHAEHEEESWFERNGWDYWYYWKRPVFVN